MSSSRAGIGDVMNTHCERALRLPVAAACPSCPTGGSDETRPNHEAASLAAQQEFSRNREVRLYQVFFKSDVSSFADRVRFRISRGMLSPYVVQDLSALENLGIAKVYLGPRNQTPSEYVRAFLTRHGLDGVAVERSKASYR
jgi:hypothetical protein